MARAMILMLLILIGLVYSAADCFSRTTIYKEYGSNNTGYFYYDPRTISAATYPVNSWIQLVQSLYDANITCDGVHCIGSNWCEPQFGCYDIMQIIPSKPIIPGLERCSQYMNIRANVILAYTNWVFENPGQGELVLIFNVLTIQSAYSTIYYTCHGVPPQVIPPELCISQTVTVPGWAIALMISAGVASMFFVPLILGGISDCIEMHQYRKQRQRLLDPDVVTSDRLPPNEFTYPVDDT